MDNDRNIKTKISRRILHYIVLLAISALFLLFFSLWTSPFYKHWYGCDASFFSMVGRGITQGMVPYRDFFDLKGPYFFFIQALGQFMSKGRLGIYLIQIPFLFFTLILITKIARLYISKKKTAAVVVIFLFAHISILWGGNILEEYMLPLNLLVIYLAVRYLKYNSLKDSPLPVFIPFINGVCFGIILFAKVTVAAPIMGVCTAFGISLLAYRRYKDFFLYCLYFILGILTAAIPVFIYFAANDSLLTMLYCVFEFAYMRSVDFSDPFTIKWELKLSACFLGVFTALFHMPGTGEAKKRSGSPAENNGPEYSVKYAIARLKRHFFRSGKERPVIQMEICLILIFTSLITYILLHLGNPWIYYFMTTEPILILSVVMLLYIYDPLILFTSVREAVCLITLFIYIFNFGMSSMDTIQTFIYDRDDPYYEQYYESANNIALLIPENERDSVFSLDIDMTLFEATQMMPCNKYQINLQFFIALNPKILDELLVFFEKTPPKWMIISETLDQFIPELYQVIMSKYHCVYFNSAGRLYLLND